jgi:hypothetical protein
LRLKKQKPEQAMNESRRRDEALGFWIPPAIFLLKEASCSRGLTDHEDHGLACPV